MEEKFKEFNVEDLEDTRVYLINIMGATLLERGKSIKTLARVAGIPKRVKVIPQTKLEEMDIVYAKKEPTISMKEFGSSKRKSR